MNLVELNLSTIPFGQPLPFALRGVGGGLLANKGYVDNAPKKIVDETREELETLKELERRLGQELEAI